MKSNKGIFDRNSEYMTRNRWLNRHPPPLPHLWAPHHSDWCWKVGWVGLRYWPAMPSIRTDVALGSPNSETFVDIAPLPSWPDSQSNSYFHRRMNFHREPLKFCTTNMNSKIFWEILIKKVFASALIGEEREVAVVLCWRLTPASAVLYPTGLATVVTVTSEHSKKRSQAHLKWQQ